MSIEENKAIAVKITEALAAGDFDYILDVFSDDVKFWVAGSIPTLSGTHNKDFLRGLQESMPLMHPEGLKLTISAMTAEGDRVAFEAESYGKHVSGKIYNNFYHILLVIKDGKVIEWKEYMDTMHANDILIS